MVNMTVHNILLATKGELLCGNENTVIETISIESKKIRENTLFVPIKGERTDGHIYIEDALSLGAQATLTSNHFHMNSEKTWILVKDTKKALQDIASYYIRKQNVPVVGITGSVGKTTTRELVAKALSAELSVYQTPGNKNSQTGVPLSLAEVGSEDIAIIELGISEFGEMEALSKI
ncbi:MAG: UDP-N-acetylmuramoyl-tripeptide--D-alanyl-D-alanine ligase, partial [Clostridiales bacterium]|nr:UDP-N-acetylmuramoyl-tripeptide--D-alanyl-D-alanine ligase [Clostridiales bacterium]